MARTPRVNSASEPYGAHKVASSLTKARPPRLLTPQGWSHLSPALGNPLRLAWGGAGTVDS